MNLGHHLLEDPGGLVLPVRGPRRQLSPGPAIGRWNRDGTLERLPERYRSRRPLARRGHLMPIVADHFRFIVGLDTHAATHAYALSGSSSGLVLAQETFPTSSTGLAEVSTWIRRRTKDSIEAVLITDLFIGSYGAVMSERLTLEGYRVVKSPTLSA